MLKREDSPPEVIRAAPLALVLRLFGLIDLLAAVAVVMPRAWMEWGCELTGLASFPDEPLAGYLARSASALYALHGVLLLAVSADVSRYWSLIRLLAIVSILHGLVMVGIDWFEGMPLWWTLAEGPTFSLTGILILAAQRYATRPTQRCSCQRTS